MICPPDAQFVLAGFGIRASDLHSICQIRDCIRRKLLQDFHQTRVLRLWPQASGHPPRSKGAQRAVVGQSDGKICKCGCLDLEPGHVLMALTLAVSIQAVVLRQAHIWVRCIWRIRRTMRSTRSFGRSFF